MQLIPPLETFLRTLTSIFAPPFKGLATLVVLYFAFGHMIFPHNDIMRGDLPDPDDYMYLTQTLDWLKGQGWYDNIQHRLDPPDGVPIHFSRLAQIPLAAGILFFEQLGLTPRGAAIMTALLEPLLCLSLSLILLRRVAAEIVPPRWAGASAYIACFSIILMFEFMPGHVDHHGLVIMMTIAAVGYLLRVIANPYQTKAAIAAGIILSIALMIALETLPWVLLISALVGLWSLRHGGTAARSATAFAAAFALTSLPCLLATRPISSWSEMDILTYSSVYVVLAAAILVPFLGVVAIDKRTTTKKLATLSRAAVGLSLALGSSLIFLHHFPALIAGPYGDIDPQLVSLLLDFSEEAKPIWHTNEAASHILNFMTMGFIAQIAAIAFVIKGQGPTREKWLFLSILQAAGIGLTFFYEYRFIGMEAALAIINLTALLYRGWGWIGQVLQGRRKFIAEVCLLLLVGPLPSVIIPALIDGRSFNVGMLLFSVDTGHTVCDMAQMKQVLRDPAWVGEGQKTIVSFMPLGPELLFRTDHAVLAAPFHMNVQGILDTNRFFSTSYPSEAENIARRRHIDLVVVCKLVPKVLMSANGQPQTLAESLFKGPVPQWLERVPATNIGNFVLYKVRPPADASTPQVKKSSGK